MPMKPLKISDITRDDNMQARVEVNPETVSEYAEEMKRGVKFDPIRVVHDGEHHWVWDGFTRLKAVESLGLQTINADIETGTRRDAFLKSLGANATHGQRRTNDDKRRAVTRALQDEECKEWSLEKIAELCGVSKSFAGVVRSQLSTVESSKSKAESTLGKDGKKRPKKYKTKPKAKAAPKIADDSTDNQDAPEPPPIVRKDVVGNDLPGSLWVTFESHSLFSECTSLIDQSIRALKKVMEHVGGEKGRHHFEQKTMRLLKDAKKDVAWYRPHAVCMRCKGKGCEYCHKLGWLIRMAHEHLEKSSA